MQTKTVVTAHLDELLENRDWLSIDHGEEIEFVNDEETIKKAAKLWGMTPAGVAAMKSALDYMAECIVEQVGQDLRDIWEEVHKEQP